MSVAHASATRIQDLVMTSYLGIVPRLPAEDLLRTAAFYSDILGFSTRGLWPTASNPRFIVLSSGDATVEFFSATPESPDGSSDRPAAQLGDAVLTIAVESLEAVHAALVGSTRIEWGPETDRDGRSRFAVRDPNGYQIVFLEEDMASSNAVDSTASDSEEKEG